MVMFINLCIGALVILMIVFVIFGVKSIRQITREDMTACEASREVLKLVNVDWEGAQNAYFKFCKDYPLHTTFQMEIADALIKSINSL